ncbi:Aldo/keto reductase family protein [Paenibacillus sp. 1_12]|uniref:aldo/keto reductase n=1 Tax=Paenibacillus sp. 1_12 TaxID=1566278 RepID=UPI0008DFD592|nr:aldo/keto reductase [Paenibacillus sp. 1_12]SFK79148.1 Aldo/keto reductase family protein [Paenibacillus sp. 1_12]
MKYAVLGNTGLKVSRIAVGGYPFSGVNKAQGWDPYSPDGRAKAIRTIHTALDSGINYIDTAAGYGSGHSEGIIGDVLKTRRQDCYVATKVSYRGDMDMAAVIRSVEESLARLQTDYVDVIQFHGGIYTQEDNDHILSGGPMEALQELQKQGKVRWLGLTTEDAHSALNLIETNLFHVVQVNYNIIYQSAALHLLGLAAEKQMGVAVMRPMTSGIFERLLEHLAPHLLEKQDIYALCLKFLLSDSRVHLLNIGMRSPEEVSTNIQLLDAYTPTFDIVDLPRMTVKIYETDDQRNGLA